MAKKQYVRVLRTILKTPAPKRDEVTGLPKVGPRSAPATLQVGDVVEMTAEEVTLYTSSNAPSVAVMTDGQVVDWKKANKAPAGKATLTPEVNVSSAQHVQVVAEKEKEIAALKEKLAAGSSEDPEHAKALADKDAQIAALQEQIAAADGGGDGGSASNAGSSGTTPANTAPNGKLGANK